MKAKEENGIIKVYAELPTAYGNVLNGYELMTDKHEEDGFLEVVRPELRANEKLGQIFRKDNYYTYMIEIMPIQVEQTTEQSLSTLELMKTEYSQKISDIIGMKEAIEKNIIDGEPIPQDIIDERNRLKQEYYDRLNTL